MANKIGYLKDKDNNQLYVEDVYSMGEVKTNKIWIDGKPIYRKVVQGTTPTVGSYDINFNWVDNLDTAIGVEGWIMFSNAYQFFIGKSQPPGENSNSEITRLIVTPDKKFQFLTSENDRLCNKPFTVILTYTKTTD